jgi:hypothetical protein
MTQRNRVQLRFECEFPGAREIEMAVSLFETAVRQAWALRLERGGSGATSSLPDWSPGDD